MCEQLKVGLLTDEFTKLKTISVAQPAVLILSRPQKHIKNIVNVNIYITLI